jgi:hypothetical protein
MSPYHRQQLAAVLALQRLRDSISELDALPDRASMQRRSEVRQRVRRELDNVRAEVATAKRLALTDEERAEHQTLRGHAQHAEALYTFRFAAQDSGDGAATAAAVPPSAVSELDEEMTQLNRPMLDLRDDEEFAVFFLRAHKNDQLMAEYLDRISTQLEGLHDNALSIGTEVRVQDELLGAMTVKTHDIDDSLGSVNRRLKKTITDVRRSNGCIYAGCCLLLLGLGGVILWQFTAANH